MPDSLPPLAVVVIGAGKGNRMKSDLAKVLHPLAGAPLIVHVLNLACDLQPAHIIAVVGHQAMEVSAVCEPYGASCVIQNPQLGTGHAVAQTEPILSTFQGDILVLYGDVPLLQLGTIRTLIQEHHAQNAAVTVLTAFLDNPAGYGRMIRNPKGEMIKIVEERDTNEREKLVQEVNSGIYCIQADFLFPALHTLGNDNAQGEQYLTDVVAVAVQNGLKVAHVIASDPQQIQGINNRLDLSRLEALLRRQICRHHMHNGVTVFDPLTTVIDQQVKIGRDTILQAGTHLLGNTTIGRYCQIGPNVFMLNCSIGDRVSIEPFCVVKNSTIPDGKTIPSFTHLLSTEESNKL